MFIRTLEQLDIQGRIKYPADKTFRSARFLTAEDGLGFSYNENKVQPGTTLKVWLKHHWEANYIVSGRGRVTDLTSGQAWALEAGVLYVVGPNDRHRLEIIDGDWCHVSIFCPALTGNERFDEDGSYEASGPIAPTDRRMFVKRADEMQRDGQEIATANDQVQVLRMLLQADDLGFGLSDVHLAAGVEPTLWTKNHWQANHILTGKGEVTDLTSGESWPLAPGTAFNVGPKDRHRIRVEEEIHLLSIVCPPLAGPERHDEEGVLPPSGPIPPGPD